MNACTTAVCMIPSTRRVTEVGIPSSDKLLAMHVSFPTSVSTFQKSTVLGCLVLFFSTGTSECKHGGPWHTLWSTSTNGLIWQSQTLRSFKTMGYVMAMSRGKGCNSSPSCIDSISPMFQVSHCNTLHDLSKVMWAIPEQACNDKRQESAPKRHVFHCHPSPT